MAAASCFVAVGLTACVSDAAVMATQMEDMRLHFTPSLVTPLPTDTPVPTATLVFATPNPDCGDGLDLRAFATNQAILALTAPAEAATNIAKATQYPAPEVCSLP
jgi:hypothetical protein